jgi:hypothetical protein
MDVYKPKPIKGLSVTYKEESYDKITYMSCSNDGFYFEHMPDENTTINIRCKADEAKVSYGGDK